MDDDERLHVGVDRLGVLRDLAQVVVLLQLGEGDPARGGTAAHLHHHRVHLLAQHAGDGGEDAHDGALGPDGARDVARDLVLERGLHARVEAGDGLLLRAARDDEAEVDGRAEGVRLLRLHAVLDGPFLLVGVLLRVVGLDRHVAVAGALVLAEEVAHLFGVGLERGGHVLGALAEEELQRDRTVELGQDGPGAGRERVELLGGEVHARGERGEDVVRGADDHEDQGEHGEAEDFLVLHLCKSFLRRPCGSR